MKCLLAIVTACHFVMSFPMAANAFGTKEMVQRYCKGMIQEFYNPDHTRTDCISDTHAIEVDASRDWAEGIGQALHYAFWTAEFEASPNVFARWYRQVASKRKPGLILVCDPSLAIDVCTDHVVRPMRIAEEFKIPITIWQCDPRTDKTLLDCQRLEGYSP